MIEEIKKEIEEVYEKSAYGERISKQFIFNILDKYNTQPDYKSDLRSIIEKVNEFIDFKLEQMNEFNITQRKETGTFWYSTYGQLEELKNNTQELSKKYGLKE